MDGVVKRLTTTLVILFALSMSSYGKKKNGFIYILEWTPMEPLSYHAEGQDPFINGNCTFQNCFITNRSSYFKDLLNFDVLLFNAAHLSQGMKLPSHRSEHQKYVFFGWDSAAYFPISTDFDNFFNLTWTYKLTSDYVLPYMVVKNIHNEVVGPRIDIQWLDIQDMAPTKNAIKQKLMKKRIAAAWIASNCYALNKRQDVAYDLKNELSNYGLQLDIYGHCGNLDCGKIRKKANDTITECTYKIKSDYYFYLALENSFSEDYVTEKVLDGLNNFAVPVVYGGANYTRFMPDGIYLNARNLGTRKLAQEMYDIIYNRSRYYEFFRWHKYYSYHDTKKDDYIDTICGLCALLNRKTNETVKKNIISEWWNTDYDSIPRDATSACAHDEEPSLINGVIQQEQSDPISPTPHTESNKIMALLSDIVNFF